MIVLIAATLGAPIRWCVDVDGGTYPATEFVYDVIDAWRAWEAAVPCAGIDDDYLGDCDAAWAGSDVWFRIGEAEGDEFGVVDLDRYDDAIDVVLAADAPWLTRAEGEASSCVEGRTAYAVVLHEIGHVLGAGHTPAPGDAVCPDGGAVLAAEAPVCAGAPFGACDVQEALRAVGPVFVDGAPVAAVTGATPFETCLEVPARGGEGIEADIRWSATDGSTATGSALCTTWATQGEIAVALAWTYPPECGGWSFAVDPWTTVSACDPPAPAAGAPGLFSVSVAGNALVVENHTDLDPWVCGGAAEWTLATAEGEPVDTSRVWAPTFSGLPDGRYRLTGTQRGPGGTATATVEVRVGGWPGGCASGGGGPAAGAAVGLAALASRRWRPRKTAGEAVATGTTCYLPVAADPRSRPIASRRRPMKKFLFALVALSLAGCNFKDHYIPDSGIVLAHADYTVMGATSAEACGTYIFGIDFGHLFVDSQGATRASGGDPLSSLLGMLPIGGAVPEEGRAIYDALEKMPEATHLLANKAHVTTTGFAPFHMPIFGKRCAAVEARGVKIGKGPVPNAQ